MDLAEQERYWQFVREGRVQEYHGIAVHPRHLSMFERVVLKRHLRYDAAADREMKIEEMRRLYRKVEGEKSSREDGGSAESALSDKVSTYFEWEKTQGRNGSGRDTSTDERSD